PRRPAAEKRPRKEKPVVSVRVNNGVPEPAPAEAAGGEPGAAQAWPRCGAGLYCPSEVRILVLDDDTAVCRVIQAALAPAGFKVDVVADPAAVEPALRRQGYHVIILDYVIPGLESEQVLEWLREHQSDASIIVVTAYPSIDSA